MSFVWFEHRSDKSEQAKKFYTDFSSRASIYA
jgi:hypothetical protein